MLHLDTTRLLGITIMLALAACGDSATGSGGAGTTGGTDVSTATSGPSSVTTSGGGTSGGSTGSTETLVWPNPSAPASSDPWLVDHHDEVRELRPRVLALNFVNARSMEEMDDLLTTIVAGFAEASRYHGYDDPTAPPVLQFELAYAIDLRDASPPPGWAFNNSTLYPREDPPDGYWGFDYEQLFSDEFAQRMNIVDPEHPADGPLPLCELVERGLVHEVWLYVDGDVPDASAAEVLGIKPRYDEDGNRLDMPLDRCAGNGCFDDEDTIPARCTRSLRIGTVNNTRGPGCYLHSMGHGMEWMARGPTLPMLTPLFEDFADFNLDDRYGTSFSDWYACGYGAPCLSFTSPTSVDYTLATDSGTIDPYVPRCGNVHFAPNAQGHYDNPDGVTVQSTCRDWWSTPGGVADPSSSFDTTLLEPYAELSDCGGPWQVWWMQSWPGLDNDKLDADGVALKSWWPYLFY